MPPDESFAPRLITSQLSELTSWRYHGSEPMPVSASAESKSEQQAFELPHLSIICGCACKAYPSCGSDSERSIRHDRLFTYRFGVTVENVLSLFKICAADLRSVISFTSMLSALRRTSTIDPNHGGPSAEANSQNSFNSTRLEDRRMSHTRSSISLPTKITSFKLGRNRAGKECKSVPDTKTTRSLADVFFSLPNELQVHILLYLSPGDVLSCRATNRTFNNIVNINQIIIARQLIPTFVLPDCTGLYVNAKFDLKHLIRMLHRLTVSTKLAAIVADFVGFEIMRIHSKAKRLAFESDWQRISRKMIPLIFTLYHFLESWRERILELPRDPVTNFVADSGIISDLLDSYDPQMLLAAEQMYLLLRQTISRQLRPPTYAIGVERAFRGWTQTPPSIVDIQIAIAVGGLDIVQQVLSKKTYGERTKTLYMFLKKVVPTENVKWQSNWQFVVHGPYAKQEAQVRPPLLRLWSCLKNEYNPYPWSAGNQLIERGIVTDVGMVKRPREFISELLGYDVLTREVIAADEDADPESDNESDGDGRSLEPSETVDEREGPSNTTAWWE